MKKVLVIGVISLFIISLVGALVFQSRQGSPSLYSGEIEGSEASSAVLLDVPFVSQKEWYCSEASATMILQYYGYGNVTQEYVNKNIAYNFETMLLESENYPENFGDYLENCTYANIDLENLRSEIDENDPVMIRLLAGKYRHTVVVVGYSSDFIYVHDPAKGKYQKMNAETLFDYWIPKDGGYLAITMDEPPKSQAL